MGQKGIAGLWDGFFPWGLLQAVAKGVRVSYVFGGGGWKSFIICTVDQSRLTVPNAQAVFGGAHSFARAQLLPFVDRGEMNAMLAETVAGGIGGGFQGLVLSPTLLLKTRVMTDPIFREKMSMLETSAQSARVGMKVRCWPVSWGRWWLVGWLMCFGG